MRISYTLVERQTIFQTDFPNLHSGKLCARHTLLHVSPTLGIGRFLFCSFSLSFCPLPSFHILVSCALVYHCGLNLPLPDDVELAFWVLFCKMPV